MLNSTTIGATFRLPMLILLFLCSPALSQQPGFSTPETSLEVADTIFRRATNSPGYLVVKEADWDRLRKVWTDSLRQKEELLIREQKKSNAKVDSLQQIEASTNNQEPTPKSDDNPTNPSDFTIPILALSLGILIIYGAVITIKLISQKIGVKTQIERLNQLEKDLELHKRNSIERERKLMRELIDVQNELEEEKSRQNQDSE